MRRSLITIILLLTLQIVYGQITSRKEANVLLRSLKSVSGKNKANSLLTLAEFFILKPESNKPDLDSASTFIKSAVALTPHDRSVQAYALLLKAYVVQESGKNSKAALIDAVTALRASNDSIHLAIAYIQLCKHFSGTIPTQSNVKTELMDKALVLLTNAGTRQQKTYGLFELENIYEFGVFTNAGWKIKFLKKLFLLEHQLNLPDDNLSIRTEMVLWDLNYGNLKVAEDELNGIIKEYKEKNPLSLENLYYRLPAIYTNRGKDTKAIFYALETIKSAKSDPYTPFLPLYYGRMANIYMNQEKWNDALYWLKSSLALMELNNKVSNAFAYVAQISYILIIQGKARESLIYVLEAKRKYQAKSNVDKKYLALCLGQSYAALKMYSIAEPFYQKMSRLSQLQLSTNEIKEDFMLNSRMGFFYNSIKQYKQADKFFKRALSERTGLIVPSNHNVRRIYVGLFKIDSAAGNYLSAIKNLQHSQLLNDSIVKLETIKQNEELQIAYETDKKKEEIRKLEKNELIQNARLQTAENSKNWLLAGAAMLLSLLGFSYNRYFLKQRSLRQLKIQREEIALINNDLKSLLQQKDHLLTEKEWLLKEVHHRVKNNLHTVICLLESQAAYLENDALTAIENSQHRIYAMSLIHQKLYQTDDIKSIDMSVYIPELIQYLGDSFGTSGQVHFDLQVESINLNISHAIPLGLIINEAVTNSIKYAFPAGRKGEILISMRDDGEKVMLILADNGVGMDSKAYEAQQPDSLGLELMKGLSADIKAQVNFDVANGTRITIVFERDALSDPDDFMSKILEKGNIT
jgi:two-component sensor histidine kinase